MISVSIKNYESDGKKITSLVLYVVKYIIVFPLVILIWFFVYSMFLFFMAPELPQNLVFMVVISLVVAIRITAYYREDLSKDFAKMIPFALLGIFLTSTTFFTIDQVEERFQEIIPFLSQIVNFIIFAVFIEAGLRIIFLIKRKIMPVVDKKLEDEIEDQIDEKIKLHVDQITEKQEDLEDKIEKETDDLEKKLENGTKTKEEK